MRQLLKRLVLGGGSKPRKVKFGLGRGLRFIINPANQTQRILGLAETEISKYVSRYGAQCRTFCDVGASDGWYPLIVHKINPSARIIACEPLADRCEKLVENAGLNGVSLGDRFTLVSSLVSEEHMRLDELLGQAEEPILIKIDVDGAELDVLQSARRVLAEKRVVLIMETHSQELEEQCIALLDALGYRSMIITPAWWRLFVPETRPIPHNQWFVATRDND